MKKKDKKKMGRPPEKPRRGHHLTFQDDFWIVLEKMARKEKMHINRYIERELGLLMAGKLIEE